MERALTNREKEILFYLTEQVDYQSARRLSELFKVSIRTVKYDMEHISEWLEFNGSQLENKRNCGYIIRSNKTKIKSRLLENQSYQVFDKNVRCRNIIIFILLSKKVVTTQAISEFLDVSKNTIISDLLQVKTSMVNYDLKYETKKGQGILIEGTESAKRFALEILIRDSLDEYKIYKIMQTLGNQKPQELPNFTMHKNFNQLFNQVIAKTNRIIDAGDYGEHKYTEILVISLRVTISLLRTTLNETLNTKHYLNYPVNAALYNEVKQLFENNQLVFSTEEYAYIFHYEDKEISGNIIDITKDLIYKVSLELKIPFYQDLQLQTSLYLHLFLHVNKEEHYKNEYNPFTEELKSNYSQLYQAVFNVVTTIFNTTEEQFVTYIVLHFMVSFRKNQEDKIKLKTIYVCSTGLGVTNLIRQTIQKHFKQLDIVGIVSVMEVDKMLAEHEIDLIISIFPIEHEGIPCVKVQAIPDTNDYRNISAAIQKLIQIKEHELTEQSYEPEEKACLVENNENLSQEEKNMNIIYQSFTIHEQICQMFRIEKDNHYREALLVHIMLGVNRIIYGQQFDIVNRKVNQLTPERLVLFSEITQLFAAQDLAINEMETLSILYYYDKNLEEHADEL